MGNLEHALSAYEHALRHNSHSLPGLTQVAGIARIKENYPKVCYRPQNLIPVTLRAFSITSHPIISPIYLPDTHASPPFPGCRVLPDCPPGAGRQR